MPAHALLTVYGRLWHKPFRRKTLLIAMLFSRCDQATLEMRQGVIANASLLPAASSGS
jgi:hypothetical protein